ncbi:MAG TPA: hypothetical protein VFR87_08970 [Nocardioidaceae bacterium]|nr:hypothetical protein [Nocardioidaceae bacterium]
MNPTHDPVTTAYLARFHGLEQEAGAELRRLTREARRAARAETRTTSTAPRRRRAWARRPSTVASA